MPLVPDDPRKEIILPGSPLRSPSTQTARQILRAGVSPTPRPEQGIAADKSGKLPVGTPAQSLVATSRNPDNPKIGQLWYRQDLNKICICDDSGAIYCFSVTGDGSQGPPGPPGPPGDDGEPGPPGPAGTGSGGSSSSGYATIQDEGTAVTQRSTMNFIGANVQAVDNAGSTRTDITVSAGSGTDTSVRVYHSVDQSIANNTLTTLAFDTERFDTASFHDVVTNNSRLTFTPAASSKYLVFAHVFFDANATGYRGAGILLNNNNFIAFAYINPTQVTVGTEVVLATVYDFINNDYVEVDVRQTSGGALNVRALADYSPIFGAIKVLG